jgi:hypothetical protein
VIFFLLGACAGSPAQTQSTTGARGGVTQQHAGTPRFAGESEAQLDLGRADLLVKRRITDEEMQEWNDTASHFLGEFSLELIYPDLKHFRVWLVMPVKKLDDGQYGFSSLGKGDIELHVTRIDQAPLQYTAGLSGEASVPFVTKPGSETGREMEYVLDLKWESKRIRSVEITLEIDLAAMRVPAFPPGIHRYHRGEPGTD